jgi:ribosomal protein L37AE/L43A
MEAVEPEIVYDEYGNPHCSECGGEARVKSGVWICLDCGETLEAK